jgi:hypothetical protein
MWNGTPSAFRYGQHVFGEAGLLLVEVDRDELEVDGRALLQLEQDVQQAGVAVLAARQADHHLVAFLDHRSTGTMAWPTRRHRRFSSLCVSRSIFAVEIARRHPGQCFEVAGVHGLRRFLEERRRTDRDARHLRQPDRDHARVGHLADADGAVDALGDEVGRAVLRAVVQQPFDGHLRKAVQVRGQRPDQQLLPEHVRRHHAQPALGVVAGAAQLGFESAPAQDQLLGAVEAALAVLGELHGVRGALQQAHAQRAFERLKAPAHGGLGGAHLRGRGREAAGLDDVHEGLHQLDAVDRGRSRKCRCHALSVYQLCKPRDYLGTPSPCTLQPLLS